MPHIILWKNADVDITIGITSRSAPLSQFSCIRSGQWGAGYPGRPPLVSRHGDSPNITVNLSAILDGDNSRLFSPPCYSDPLHNGFNGPQHTFPLCLAARREGRPHQAGTPANYSFRDSNPRPKFNGFFAGQFYTFPLSFMNVGSIVFT